jgi:hypothetical protein
VSIGITLQAQVTAIDWRENNGGGWTIKFVVPESEGRSILQLQAMNGTALQLGIVPFEAIPLAEEESEIPDLTSEFLRG